MAILDKGMYFIFLCIVIKKGECVVPYNDVKSDYETLLSAYRMPNSLNSADVVPTDLTSGPITIYLGIGLYAIMDYDEVGGKIQLVASMKMEWLDEIKSLTGTTFMESIQTLFIAYDQIWTPDLVLMSAVDSVERIGDETYKVRFNVSSGYCKWYPRMIINAACTPDMTYYPFDKQTCVLTVTPWNRDSNAVQLVALTNEWNTDNLEKSSVWDVSETSSEAYINSNNSRYHMDFKITIKRKPFFLALVIVLPVLLLSLLTGFLFLLPPGSGERVGFGMTCFLSFVVLLQTLMSFMPEVSAPMSILCFYVIVMLSFSVVLSIANVFLLRMYLNPSKEDLPGVFLIAIEIITCKIWRRCPKCPKIKLKCPSIKLKCLKREHSSEYLDETTKDDSEHYKLRIQDTVHNIRFSKRLETVKETSLSDDTHSSEHDSGLYIGDDGDNDAENSSAFSQSSGNFQLARCTSFSSNTTPKLIDDVVDSVPQLSGSEGSRKRRLRSASPVQKPSTLTWEYLAHILDLFFIVVFCIVQTIFTIFYLVPLGAQY